MRTALKLRGTSNERTKRCKTDWLRRCAYKALTQLTFQYDKVLYLIEDNEKNIHLASEVVKILDYPDGHIAVQYGDRKLAFKTFDKLAKIDQTQVIDNKRLGKVLRFAQEKQEEFEQAQRRERSKSSPKRTAQR